MVRENWQSENKKKIVASIHKIFNLAPYLSFNWTKLEANPSILIKFSMYHKNSTIKTNTLLI